MATEAFTLEHATTGIASYIGGSAVLGAVLVFLRWLLTLAGGRQDARIAKLEHEMEQLRNRLMLVGQVTNELIADVERLDPGSPSLKRARAALKAAFPIERAPADLEEMARKIDGGAQS